MPIGTAWNTSSVPPAALFHPSAHPTPYASPPPSLHTPHSGQGSAYAPITGLTLPFSLGSVRLRHRCRREQEDWQTTAQRGCSWQWQHGLSISRHGPRLPQAMTTSGPCSPDKEVCSCDSQDQDSIHTRRNSLRSSGPRNGHVKPVASRHKCNPCHNGKHLSMARKPSITSRRGPTNRHHELAMPHAELAAFNCVVRHDHLIRVQWPLAPVSAPCSNSSHA